MAFLGYFTQFRIAVLARLSAKFTIFLTGSLLFAVIFSNELEHFEFKLNLNKNNVKNKGPRSCLPAL